MTALVVVAALVYFQSTFIPALGLYFNQVGHNAFLSGNLDRAEPFHRIAAAIIPDSAVILENAGLVYLERYRQTRNKRYLDDADMFYKRAIADDPNAPRLRRRLEAVLVERLTGDPETDRPIHLKIVETDRQVLERDPFNPFVRRNLAEALYHSGSREEAQQELSKAIELEPNYVSAYLRLAEWHKESGNVSESELHKSKAMSIIAKYQHVTKPEPYEALLLGRRDGASQ
ncbi:MAG: hypothetical protein HY646_07985 [Acidobacteria bacterium]|nr:hypothetical protein [Acidobacteriota bacterium]